MTDRTEQMDDLQLVALPSAVGCAEMFVRFSLTEWKLRSMRDDAGAVAADLARAVVAAADPDQPGIITARVRLSGGNLVIELESARPVQAPTAPPGGRSGVDDLGPGRHMLWTMMPLPGGMDAGAVPLPRRQRKPSPEAARLAAEEAAGTHPPDPDVLGRILYGLNSSKHQK
ncbi:ATP-binding protein [Actinokineospora sp. G85]|uniref:ATP-binding protein n=1 Tax=Actinokineospora sp. G85 TaxID=3406626 RepID=UPI003C74A36E